jgi:GTP cyclohydrolase I
MLQPHGVGVYLEANHLCTQMRGVEEASQLTKTMVWLGAYDEEPSMRADFLRAAGLR